MAVLLQRARWMSTPTELLPPPDPVAAPPEPSGPQAPVDVRNVFLTLLAVLVLVLVLQLARPFLIPVVFAVLVSYALEPVVAFLVAHHVRRIVATAILALALLSALGATGYALMDNAMSAVNTFPVVAERLRRALHTAQVEGSNPMEKVQRAANEFKKAASEAANVPEPERGVMRVHVEEPAVKAWDYVWLGGRTLGLVGRAATILFLVFFLLSSGDLYKRKVVKIVGPALSKKKTAVQILEEIDSQIARFLLVQVLIALSIALTTGLFLWALGLKQPAVWGLAAGVFSTVPYFGPLVVAVGLGAIAFVQLDSLPMAAYAAVGSMLIATIKGSLLAPWLTGKAARMNQVAIVLGLLFWTWLWGVPGMLLAVPMMTTMKAICDRIDGFRPVGELLGE